MIFGKFRTERRLYESSTAFLFRGDTVKPESEKGGYPLPRQIFVIIIQQSSFFATIFVCVLTDCPHILKNGG